MANSFVQLPYTATTSGQILDSELLTVGANAVERERIQVAGTAASQIAPVTTSGGLLVTLSTVPGYLVTLSSNPVTGQVVALSSGTVTLSSNPTVAISSGIVTLSSAMALSSGIVTLSSPTSLSSGTVTLSSAPTVNVSSGVVTLSSATSLSSGVVTLTSDGLTGVFVTGSSGAIAQVTSSGGMWVQLTNGSVGSGSTAVNIVAAAGYAPVTSSYGLRVVLGSTATLTAQITTTLGAPVTQHLTTAALWLYSVNIFSTAGTAGNAIAVFSATSALSTQTDPKIRMASPTAGTNQQLIYNRGMYFPNGLQVTDSLTFGTTGTNTMGVGMTVEYEL